MLIVLLPLDSCGAVWPSVALVGSCRVTVDFARSICSLNVADSTGVAFTAELSSGTELTNVNGAVVSFTTVDAGDVALTLPAGSVAVATPERVPSARLDVSTGTL